MNQIKDRLDWIRRSSENDPDWNPAEDNEWNELIKERDREQNKLDTREHPSDSNIDKQIENEFVDLGDEVLDSYATGEIVDSWN